MGNVASPHLQGSGCDSGLGLSSEWSLCSRFVHEDFLWVLQFPPSVHKHVGRWIGYANYPLLFVCVCVRAWCPAMPW